MAISPAGYPVTRQHKIECFAIAFGDIEQPLADGGGEVAWLIYAHVSVSR